LKAIFVAEIAITNAVANKVSPLKTGIERPHSEDLALKAIES